jgi:hypothetical protein
MGELPARPQGQSSYPPPPEVKQRAKRTYPGETKRERFLRIGEYRIGEALHKIALLKPLSGADYEWTEHEASMMVAALRRAIDEVAEAFVPRPPTTAAKEVKFTFSRRHS